MDDLSGWDLVNCFSLEEAAMLMAGKAPFGNGLAAEAIPFERGLVNAFRDAMSKFYAATHSFESCDASYRAGIFEANMLRSTALEAFEKAWLDDDLDTSFASYLESAIDAPMPRGGPQLRREELARWLHDNGHKSAYQFGRKEEQQLVSTADKPLAERERNTLLSIIGVMIDVMLKAEIRPESETQIIDEMVDRFGHHPGIKKRTLEQKFALAKRMLQ